MIRGRPNDPARMAAAIARHDARKRARRIRSAVAFLILSALLTGYGVAFFYRITS